MATILITGAEGQVGRELLELRHEFPFFSFLAAGKKELDITDAPSTERYFNDHQIDYCINCAAYTAVDKAESEPEAVKTVNIDGVSNLAKIAAENGAPMIQLSSDYVYHNDLNRPLREDDPTTPRGVYAASKLEGDRRVLSRHPEGLVIRSSWIYSAFGNNFVKTMLRLGKEKEEVRVVYDQIGAPTYGRDLARAMLMMIRKKEKGTLAPGAWSGIYHYANEGVCSWYDFAHSIFEQCCISCRVTPIESKDFPSAAQRPCFSVLNKQKIKNTFDLSIPYWRKSLQHCLERIARQED